MTSRIVWLEGGAVSAAEVGERASVLARLQAGGMAVPRTFVLGQSLLKELAAAMRRRQQSHLPAQLPAAMQRAIAEALRTLGGSFAIRRSPLEGFSDRTPTVSTGGRPQRETYLHLTDVAEVAEATRRIWGTPGLGSSPAPVAIMVQRFVPPDLCAVVRRDRTDPEILHITSTLGVGDLLAAGLVVPDRHTVRRRDGTVIRFRLGRKAQMTVPRPEGGVARVPVPPQAARRLAMDDATLCALHAAWLAAEDILPELTSLDASYTASVGRWYVTSGEAPLPAVQEEVLLG